MYLCNPNNPTGTNWTAEEIKSFVAMSPNTLFVVDEAYYEFAGNSSAKLTLSHSNLIIARTFSKAFGLAAMRIGYTIAHPSLNFVINKMRNYKNYQLFQLLQQKPLCLILNTRKNI